MSRQNALTIAVATMVSAALGGLVIWKVVRTRRRRSSPQQLDQGQPELSEQDSLVEPQASELPLLPLPEQVLGVEPTLVTSCEEWEMVWPAVQRDLSVYPVLGLDCEWVTEQHQQQGEMKPEADVSVKGKAAPVSLLQMATYSGLCVLIRLPKFRSSTPPVPRTLLDVLQDPTTLKVGVGCYEDAGKLARDYGVAVNCTVDLRYLAMRQRQVTVYNGLSLKSLAQDILNFSLDKSLKLRCSDWEAEQLSQEQVTYAGRDAQVSVALFFHLLGLNSPETQNGTMPERSFKQLVSRCQGLVDVPFRGRGGEGDEKGPEGPGERRRRSKRATLDSQSSGDQQVPDPRKNRRKPLGVGYSARKSPLYDNCFLHAPDGQPLCTCDKKKAKWYLDKGIGELMSEEPFIVRLKFEPSGRPESQQDYYLTAKENLCVVCGKTDSYIRKNVVPHEYRRHFPTEMKDHNSHDVLLLCTACHAASNYHDNQLKQKLAEDYGAPLGCEEGVRLLEDSDRRHVRSAARALLNAADSLPHSRQEELLAVIKAFFNTTEVTPDMLKQAASLETRIFNESYIPHGLKVVQAYAHRGLRGLMELEKCWRQHFLSSMQPRYLPPLWSVEHNHTKLLRKYGENLVIQLS
nr:PREDICTED: exonuclease 3'-5' domain-containing protein 2 isoform X1 [Lepisosteus oculatus]XP_015206475.1 PREDICTED: exonuclease 3'-5' domain-containing protein 2 isoform X1 [Lepisosteus oculatus]XP_015206476.1 PREDICTED: exonuclease 3'-5' domain-containing protein 2 isoform X1 [Lepisosteus oculatus]